VKPFVALFALTFFGFTYWYFHRPIVYPPGVLVSSEPQQADLTGETPPIEYRGFHLQPLARFSIDARVLSRKVYRYDKQSVLVPVDLALGWGPMSDQSVLARLTITQSMRFYWYHWAQQPPIAPEEIVSHSTNVHIIPSSSSIAARCKSLPTGSLVHLSGDLVEASGPGIKSWRSSLSRTDTGNGSCELMWVKEMSILNVGLPQDRQVVAKY
jgi:hypothetical protein